MAEIYASSNTGEQYSLLCRNESESNWFFYLFVRVKDQSADEIYSLAWLASPYKLRPGSFIKFTWSDDFSFVWYGPGMVAPGVVFPTGGETPAALQTANQTTFNLDGGAPGFTTPSGGEPAEQFLLNIASNVPNNEFATGIGLSGQGILVKQSLTNVPQQFDSEVEYWVGAAVQIQMMQILTQDTIINSTGFAFPVNSYELEAVLNSNNLWTIT